MRRPAAVPLQELDAQPVLAAPNDLALPVFSGVVEHEVERVGDAEGAVDGKRGPGLGQISNDALNDRAGVLKGDSRTL